MTLRQLWYRYVYLKSPAWKMTRRLRKKGICHKCSVTKGLHLHHKDYYGYIWWNLFLPDLISKMETLCPKHHRQEHR